MTKGLFVLALSYALSQFYRAFLPVLSPILREDLGATPQDLATASGVWFLVFAAMQIPVGAALDRFGPRWTASILFALGGAGGALVFALAQTPTHITWAMALLAAMDEAMCVPIVEHCMLRAFPWLCLHAEYAAHASVQNASLPEQIQNVTARSR